MKTRRHAAILAIVQAGRVSNQLELRQRLQERGFDVTQATLSRDLKELGLAKVADPTGGSFYAVPPDRAGLMPSLERLVPTLLLTVTGVGPLAVVRTPPGSAEALGGALDASAWEDVLGCIAGDDTLLIIARSDEARTRVEERLRAMVAG